jgi:hypothetical protein
VTAAEQRDGAGEETVRGSRTIGREETGPTRGSKAVEWARCESLARVARGPGPRASLRPRADRRRPPGGADGWGTRPRRYDSERLPHRLKPARSKVLHAPLTIVASRPASLLHLGLVRSRGRLNLSRRQRTAGRKHRTPRAHRRLRGCAR